MKSEDAEGFELAAGSDDDQVEDPGLVSWMMGSITELFGRVLPSDGGGADRVPAAEDGEGNISPRGDPNMPPPADLLRTAASANSGSGDPDDEMV
jgi:hypothetical protein